MQKIKFKGTTLSPIHIGTGEELEPLEYVVTNKDRFYKIKLDEILGNLSETEREKFYSLIDKNDLVAIREFVSRMFFKNTQFNYYNVDVTDSFRNHYKEKKNDIRNQVIINPFIRNQRTFAIYIPGSSLKGAIRTAFLNAELLIKLPNDQNMWKDRSNILEGKLLEYHYINPKARRWQEKDKIDIKKDPFRVLKIPDIPLQENSTIISMVYNRRFYKNGKYDEKEGVQTNFEVTKSLISNKSVEFNGEITIDVELMVKNYGKGRWIKKDIEINEIIKSLNDFYGSKLYYDDKRFFEKSQIKELSAYSKQLVEEFEEFDKNKEALIRVGRHSGFESITLDKVRRTRQGKFQSNSKTICENKFPMGWIKLSFDLSN